MKFFLLFQIVASNFNKIVGVGDEINFENPIKSRADGSFSYEESDPLGPSNWDQVNKNCGLKSQSPINIITGNTKRDAFRTFKIDYFTKSVESINITNNGYTVNYKIKFRRNTASRLFWFGASGAYLLDSLHFHWGPKCGGGSEHVVNGHRYTAEVHLVHFNEKYRTIGNAIDKKDGLAVLGVFFEIVNEEFDGETTENKFTKFLNKVPNKGDTFAITDPRGLFTIKDLIKNEFKEYFSYRGSLTTPPCSESVQWIVSKRPMRILSSELDEFSKLLGTDGKSMAKTFRPAQPLNGRIVNEVNKPL